MAKIGVKITVETKYIPEGYVINEPDYNVERKDREGGITSFQFSRQLDQPATDEDRRKIADVAMKHRKAIVPHENQQYA